MIPLVRKTFTVKLTDLLNTGNLAGFVADRLFGGRLDARSDIAAGQSGDHFTAFKAASGQRPAIGQPNFVLVTSAFTYTTAAGALQITGLPFPASSVSSYRAYCPVLYQGIVKPNYTTFIGGFGGAAGVNNLLFFGSGQNVALQGLSTPDVPSGGAPAGVLPLLAGSISYVV